MNLEQLTMDDLAPLESRIDPEYPEQLRDMATSIYAHFLEVGDLAEMGRGRLAELALIAVEGISADLGGRFLYVHKGHNYRLSRRDQQMMNEYRGDNIAALAARYHLTEVRVRQIVAVWKAAEFKRRQPPLFEQEENGL